MATPTPSEKRWRVAPTRCLPSPSILTRFATESTAGWQAPHNRQLPFDRLMFPGVISAVLTTRRQLPVYLDEPVGMSQRCHQRTAVAPPSDRLGAQAAVHSFAN